MNRPLLEFWFEFASTYSYPAALRIEELASQHGCSVRFQPFLLGPIFRAQGWQDSPFNLFPKKSRYMWRDLERICAELGLRWQKPSQFPRNGLLAARLVCAAGDSEWLPELVRRVYTANFADDQDIAQPEVLRACLNGLVSDPDALLAAAQQDATKARLRQNTERAAELGIFGAPMCVVGQELFWGNDRLETAARWASRASPAE
ncbi:MAG TPA: 2-hydroxychromene-2-carboxylate isomerase [Polyangiaceae bacterium]